MTLKINNGKEARYTMGDVLELRIEKIVPRGLGLAFLERLTVFVPLAAPGDVVRAEIVEIKGKIAFAEIVEVLTPSPERIDPPCEYFGTCGGCDMMQLNYSAQLQAKVGMIRDCLVRIGKFAEPIEIKIIGSPEEFGYRLRAQWHADTDSGKMGYYQRNSRTLVDVKRCMVLLPELQNTMDRLRGELANLLAQGVIQIDAAAGADGTVSVYSPDLVETTEAIEFQAAGERLSFSARSFFQGNRFLIDQLVKTALDGVSGDLAFDLYSGVGLFTLPLARRFLRVVAVEDNEQAVDFAQTNSKTAGLSNIEFRSESVRRFVSVTNTEQPDLVLLDPPRAGTEKETMLRIIELRPKKIVYVACEPSLLARDLRRFVENGYSIDSITAIDLFPQTHHVETVAHLSSLEFDRSPKG